MKEYDYFDKGLKFLLSIFIFVLIIALCAAWFNVWGNAVDCNNVIGKVKNFENYQSRQNGVTVEVFLEDDTKIMLYQGFSVDSNIESLRTGVEIVECEGNYGVKNE